MSERAAQPLTLQVAQRLACYVFLFASLCGAARLDGSVQHHMSAGSHADLVRSRSSMIQLGNSLIHAASRGAERLTDDAEKFNSLTVAAATNITALLAQKAALAQKASIAQIAEIAEVHRASSSSSSEASSLMQSLESHLTPQQQKQLNHLGEQFLAYEAWKGQALMPLIQIVGLPFVFLLCLFAKHNGGLCYNGFLLILLVVICWLNMNYWKTFSGKTIFAILTCLVLFQTLKVCLFQAFSDRPRKRLPKKEPGWDLLNFWSSFFDRCRDCGITEIYRGRVTTDGVSRADARIMLGLPGLVILQCALKSLSKEEDGVEFPDGTKVDEMIHPVCQETCRFFSRVIAAYHELQELEALEEAERIYLEERALYITQKPLILGNAKREFQVNKAATSFAAAALELSQLSTFRQSMQRALQQVLEAPSEP